MSVKRTLALAGTLALLFALGLPAQASPPERIDDFPGWFIGFDAEHRLVTFFNTTRHEVCETAPPIETERPVTLSTIKTKPGAQVEHWHATRPTQVWKIDDDVDAAAEGPCPDTDEQSQAWATGDMTLSANNNDFFVSGTRTNVFGPRAQGTVHDIAGNRWHYSLTLRFMVDRSGEFSVVANNFNLKQIGG